LTSRTPTAAGADAWGAQRRWSNAASALKSGIEFWRTTALALAIAGAVLATLATQVGLKSGLGEALSIAAAVALAVVPGIRAGKLGTQTIEAWTRARSVSEGLKEEIYLYLTGTPPYDGDDRDVKLGEKTSTILKDAEDIDEHTIGRPDDDKPLPVVDNVESYLTNRVQPQYDGYYPRSAAQNKQRLDQFRRVEFGLAVLGAVLGAVAAATKISAVGAWVAVVTTVAAAITAHIAASRYEHLMITYRATARQLRARVAQWRESADHSPLAAARLVRDCEDVISRENESWMAAWTRDAGEKAAPASP
jgi:hypothetical protein